ncbi:U-box domain-containing protein 44-like [Typha latifolia]|uniref:U-box domain-containing protein 44-like n=1 Tax=Typha latifolia TaxID=4733 RepID=UPI003C2D64FD
MTRNLTRGFSDLLSDLDSSAHEILALDSPHPLFAALISRLDPVLESLRQNEVSDWQIYDALESLESELGRARAVLTSPSGSTVTAQDLEISIRGIGRCLGLVVDAWVDAPEEIRERADELRREMVTVTFGGRMVDRGGDVVVDAEDLVVRVKKGDAGELGVVVSEIGGLIGEGFLVEEEGGRLIPALLNRLSSAKCDNRVKIITVLRSFAVSSDENKERMASIEALTSIVRSLSRDIEERREAVGLLLDISAIVKVRQKLGRIQGCIVMLVTLRNGDDSSAKNDAVKLLGILSSNTQNVLLMAEAGYFAPLIHYLKEGSDTNKVLMATAISRMLLTDQMKASLGEEGSIESLVYMFASGKLEAKLAALGALRNLSSVTENIEDLINSGVVAHLFQLLFSVTSVLMTLREPASAILATLAQSERILLVKDVAQQILSLLNLSSPAIQIHLLQALNRISSHSNAKRVRAKIRENGAMQLLLPFLTESNAGIRILALNVVFNLSKDFGKELNGKLGESHLNILVKIFSSSTSESEKAAAVGILSNLPVKDKKATEILMKANLLPLLISSLGTNIATSLTPARTWLLESISGALIRFTVPWDKKLQTIAVVQGVFACLVKLLSDGSIVAKSRAATSLAQLSQNSLALCTAKSSRWFCVSPSFESHCEIHNGNCTVKSTFCLFKGGVVAPLVQVLEGKEREADEAVLEALSTLMQDEIWVNGSKVIEKALGVQALMRILEVGSLKAQEKAIWILERIFRLETHREQYGEAAQVLFIDLAQNGNFILKPMIAKILAHLELLQMQSSYFGEATVLAQ